jgi:hypothetical protein
VAGEYKKFDIGDLAFDDKTLSQRHPVSLTDSAEHPDQRIVPASLAA